MRRPHEEGNVLNLFEKTQKKKLNDWEERGNRVQITRPLIRTPKDLIGEGTKKI